MTQENETTETTAPTFLEICNEYKRINEAYKHYRKIFDEINPIIYPIDHYQFKTKVLELEEEIRQFVSNVPFNVFEDVINYWNDQKPTIVQHKKGLVKIK